MPELRGTTPAPDFPGRLEWINVDHPLRLAELRGKVVLLDFWASSAVSCQHDVGALNQLSERFRRELVVIGVHAARFPAEKLTANLREATARLGIAYPVVNDAGHELWQRYGVDGWPTVVLIDPAGAYVGSQAGEVDAERLAALIAAIAAEFASTGELERSAPRFALHAVPHRAPLRHPAKLLASGDGRLFVADTGHHRVLELALDDGLRSARLLRVFGSGRPDLVDGEAAAAAFRHPRGLLLLGDTLWVADTGNHALRAIDLGRGTVRRVAGTGALGRGPRSLEAPPAELALRSPWALAGYDADVLLVAMAGSNQVWAFADGRMTPFAGDGQESLRDGPVLQASFGQPSDLALAMGHLFVADAGASAIRAVSLGADPRVHTVVGQGLYEWGDTDGEGARVRLQHPLGLAVAGDRLFIADSYNHKLKELDPASGRVRSLVGSGMAGMGDGALLRAQFYQPEGLSWADGRLFVADTNNHAVRVVDVERKAVATLAIEGLTAPAPAAGEGAEG